MTTSPPSRAGESGYNNASNSGVGSNRGSSNVALDIAYIAVFAALISVLGFVAITGPSPVPIVLQNAATILAGLVLGARRGFLATGLFLLVSLVFPVLTGKTFMQALAGPTAGFLAGYLLGSLAAGLIAYRSPWKNKAATAGVFILAGLAALFLQYFFGIPFMMWRTGMGFFEALASLVPHLIGDAIKLPVIIAIALAVHAAFPQLRRS
nr:BioY family protein [Streptococcus thermophilus]